MSALALFLLAQLPRDSAKDESKPQALDRAYTIGVLGDYDADHVADYGVAGCVRVDGARHLVVRVFSGRDDRLLKELATPVVPTCTFVLHEAQFSALADFDADGCIELAARAGNAWLLDGRTGKIVHDFGLGSAIVGVLGDVEHDGKPELLIDTYLDPATNPHGGTFERQVWNTATGNALPFGMPHGRADQLIDDIDGDGLRDLVVFTNSDDKWFQVLSGKDAHVLASFDPPQRGERITPRGIALLPARGERGGELLLFGDCDRPSSKSDDGSPAAFASLSLAARTITFERHLDFELADNENGGCGEFRAALLGDLNGDGAGDFALAIPSYVFTGTSLLAAFSGKDGATLWTCSGVTAEALNPSVDVLTDRNGDGIADLLVSIAGVEHGVVAIISGRTGELLKQFTP